MNPARIVYENAPASIPVPADMRHRRVEATFWPLDEPTAIHADHDPTKAAKGLLHQVTPLPGLKVEISPFSLAEGHLEQLRFVLDIGA